MIPIPSEGKKRKKKRHHSTKLSEETKIIEKSVPEKNNVENIRNKWVNLSNSLNISYKKEIMIGQRFFEFSAFKLFGIIEKSYFNNWKSVYNTKIRIINKKKSILFNWKALISHSLQRKHKFELISAFNGMITEKRYSYSFYIWLNRINSIKNWEMMTFLLFQREKQKIESMIQQRQYFHSLWDRFRIVLQYYAKRRTLYYAKTKYFHQKTFQKFTEELLKRFYTQRLKKGKSFIDKQRMWTILVSKEIRYNFINKCKICKKNENRKNAFFEWKTRLVLKNISKTLKEAKIDCDREEKNKLLLKMMKKWNEKMRIKIYSRKFARAHLVGVIRDYSIYIQNRAAKTIQRWWISIINQQKKDEMLLRRALLSWRRMPTKIAHSFFEAPEISLVVHPQLSLGLDEFCNIQINDLYRERIDFAYNRNMKTANEIGEIAGKMIEEVISIPDIKLSSAKPLENVEAVYVIQKDETTYDIDFDFDEIVSSSCSSFVANLDRINGDKEIPINQKMVNRISKASFNQRDIELFNPEMTIDPLHNISLIRLEKDIRCRTFDENNILMSSFLNNAFREQAKEVKKCVKPLIGLENACLFKFNSNMQKRIEKKFDLSILSVIRKCFIPKFDILQIDYGFLSKSKSFGFDKNSFDVCFNKCIDNACLNCVSIALDNFDTLGAVILPKKHVEFVFSTKYDGKPTPVVNVAYLKREILTNVSNEVIDSINDPLIGLDDYIEFETEYSDSSETFSEEEEEKVYNNESNPYSKELQNIYDSISETQKGLDQPNSELFNKEESKSSQHKSDLFDEEEQSELINNKVESFSEEEQNKSSQYKSGLFSEEEQSELIHSKVESFSEEESGSFSEEEQNKSSQHKSGLFSEEEQNELSHNTVGSLSKEEQNKSSQYKSGSFSEEEQNKSSQHKSELFSEEEQSELIYSKVGSFSEEEQNKSSQHKSDLFSEEEQNELDHHNIGSFSEEILNGSIISDVLNQDTTSIEDSYENKSFGESNPKNNDSRFVDNESSYEFIPSPNTSLMKSSEEDYEIENHTFNEEEVNQYSESEDSYFTFITKSDAEDDYPSDIRNPQALQPYAKYDEEENYYEEEEANTTEIDIEDILNIEPGDIFISKKNESNNNEEPVFEDDKTEEEEISSIESVETIPTVESTTSSMSIFDFIFDPRGVVEMVDLSFSSLIIKINEEITNKCFNIIDKEIKRNDDNESNLSGTIIDDDNNRTEIHDDYYTDDTTSTGDSQIYIPPAFINNFSDSYETLNIDSSRDETQDNTQETLQLSDDFSEIPNKLIIEGQRPEKLPEIKEDLVSILSSNIPEPPIICQAKIDYSSDHLPVPIDPIVSMEIPPPPTEKSVHKTNDYSTQSDVDTMYQDFFNDSITESSQKVEEMPQNKSDILVKDNTKHVSINISRSFSKSKSKDLSNESVDDITEIKDVQISGTQIIPKVPITSISGMSVRSDEEDLYYYYEEEDYYESDDDSISPINNEDLDNVIGDFVADIFANRFEMHRVGNDFVEELIGDSLSNCLSQAVGNMVLSPFNVKNNERNVSIVREQQQNMNKSTRSRTEIDLKEFGSDTESVVISDKTSTPETSDGEFMFEKDSDKLDLDEFNDIFISMLNESTKSAISNLTTRFNLK